MPITKGYNCRKKRGPICHFAHYIPASGRYIAPQNFHFLSCPDKFGISRIENAYEQKKLIKIVICIRFFRINTSGRTIPGNSMTSMIFFIKRSRRDGRRSSLCSAAFSSNSSLCEEVSSAIISPPQFEQVFPLPRNPHFLQIIHCSPLVIYF